MIRADLPDIRTHGHGHFGSILLRSTRRARHTFPARRAVYVIGYFV